MPPRAAAAVETHHLLKDSWKLLAPRKAGASCTLRPARHTTVIAPSLVHRPRGSPGRQLLPDPPKAEAG